MFIPRVTNPQLIANAYRRKWILFFHIFHFSIFFTHCPAKQSVGFWNVFSSIMYGLILENIASYLRNHFGEKIWQEIRYVSGIEEDTFAPFDVYSEGIVHKMIWAAQDVTASPLDEMMEAIGNSFYDFTAGYEYHKVQTV